ncbi:MAG TPA: MAPEG family protein [Burkholderiales bacterium]|nr:MAPEG family protein [Burkholderiales bacterium]
MHSSILLPAFALVVLTAIVAGALYRERFSEMRRKRLDPQSLSTSANIRQSLDNTQASDNFKNLFEMPVLFYTLCAFLAAGQVVSSFFVVGAWLYVLLRYVHSYIHLTYNRVMHRFLAYVLSMLVLFTLWAVYGIRLFIATFQSA